MVDVATEYASRSQGKALTAVAHAKGNGDMVDVATEYASRYQSRALTAVAHCSHTPGLRLLVDGN